MMNLETIKEMLKKETGNLPMTDKHVRVAARKIKESEGDLALITYAIALRRYYEIQPDFADSGSMSLEKVAGIFEAIAIEKEKSYGCMLW